MTAVQTLNRFLDASLRSLTEEIHDAIPDPIMRECLGLALTPKITLKAAGLRANRSTARMQQKSVQAIHSLAKHPMPILGKILQTLETFLGDQVWTVPEVEAHLRAAGYLQQNEPFLHVLRVARLHTSMFYLIEGRYPALVGTQEACSKIYEIYDDIKEQLSELTCIYGAYPLTAFVDFMTTSFEDIAERELRLALASYSDVQFFVNDTWIRLARKTPSRYVTSAQKILSVAPRIQADTLFAGIVRALCGAAIPPQDVLIPILCQDLNLDLANDIVVSHSPKCPNDVLDSIEKLFYAVLSTHGGILAHGPFVQELEAAGVHSNSLIPRLARSAILDHPTRGIYRLRGSRP